MTLREYSKMTGLNIKKIYNYSKYKNFYTTKYSKMKYSELPFCIRLTINQVITNLKCIEQNKIALSNGSALIKSGFKIYSKPFANNIMNGFNLNSKHNIDRYLDNSHIRKLIEISEIFSSN